MNRYTPLHSVQDRNKLADLIASMERIGWKGVPLVADGDQLITGSHRYAAAIATGINCEVVDIRDVYPEWDALHADFNYPVIGDYDYVCALEALPADIREMYGIDAH